MFAAFSGEYGERLRDTDERIYTLDAGDLLDVLRDIDDDIESTVLIGHNPGSTSWCTLSSGWRWSRRRLACSSSPPMVRPQARCAGWWRTGGLPWRRAGLAAAVKRRRRRSTRFAAGWRRSPPARSGWRTGPDWPLAARTALPVSVAIQLTVIALLLRGGILACRGPSSCSWC